MRTAIVIAPYHTNGGYPPLGAAYLNATLRRAEGIDVSIFDLQFLLAAENPYLWLTFKKHHNIGKNIHLVQALLDLRFLLYCLYGERYPEFEWELTNDLAPGGTIPAAEHADVRRAFLSLALGVRTQAAAYARLVAASEPDLVLCSTYIPNVLFTLLIGQALKQLRPETFVLLGGPGTALPDVQRFVLAAGLADGIATGDGEPVLEEIVRRWGATGRLDLAVHGVATDPREVHGARPQGPALDTLPIPSYDGFPAPGHDFGEYERNWKYEYRSKRFETFLLPMQTSRGCVLRCAFCSESAFWQRFNSRQPAAIVQELRYLKERYGARCFSFNASLVNHDDDWHHELLERLCASGLDITWWGYYRPTRDLTPATTALMHRAGCRMVSLGIESFHQPALDAMKKGTRADEALEALLALATRDILVDFSLLTGFPVGRTSDLAAECAANTEFARALAARLPQGIALDFSVGYLVRLEPYSQLHVQPERYGIMPGPDEVRVPDGLAELRPALGRLGGSWVGSEGFEEKRAAARALAEVVTRMLSGERPSAG